VAKLESEDSITYSQNKQHTWVRAGRLVLPIDTSTRGQAYWGISIACIITHYDPLCQIIKLSTQLHLLNITNEMNMITVIVIALIGMVLNGFTFCTNNILT